MLIEHMSQGKAFETFAAQLSVSKDTLYEWARNHSEFSDALNIGRIKAYEFWEKLGIQGAMGEQKVNHAMWALFMKNRFGWADKQELTGADGQPLQMQMAVANLTPEQVKVMAQKVIELASDPDLQED